MNNVWYTSLSPVKEAYFNCIGQDAGSPVAHSHLVAAGKDTGGP